MLMNRRKSHASRTALLDGPRSSLSAAHLPGFAERTAGKLPKNEATVIAVFMLLWSKSYVISMYGLRHKDCRLGLDRRIAK